jgi:cytochrome c553
MEPPSWALPGAPDSADTSYSAVGFVLLGLSTSLSGHGVSPINPRLVFMGYDTFLAFQRGAPRVEVATLARDGSTYNFYLLTFTRACDQSSAGCSPAELYTPRFETDWTSVVIQDDEDLKDTPSDCRQCHQRGRATSMLLMREISGPWTHFFEPLQATISDPPLPGVSGSDLTHDYELAKGEEPYGGVTVTLVTASSPEDLEIRVGEAQPLVFDSGLIENELFPYGPNGYPAQALPSPTWQAAWEAFKRGEQLALPHADARPTDPQKQARLTEAYARYRAGALSADELPDLSDIFPDDPHTRAQLGLQTEPDATPPDALIQACGSCHNDVLDQTLSRARFNIAIARMDRAELDTAIDRIGRDRSAPGVMPPPDARQLDQDVRTQLLDYLRRSAWPNDDIARLDHAARLGMAGGGRR